MRAGVGACCTASYANKSLNCQRKAIFSWQIVCYNKILMLALIYEYNQNGSISYCQMHKQLVIRPAGLSQGWKACVHMCGLQYIEVKITQKKCGWHKTSKDYVEHRIKSKILCLYIPTEFCLNFIRLLRERKTRIIYSTHTAVQFYSVRSVITLWRHFFQHKP